jgi:hypothetical protein
VHSSRCESSRYRASIGSPLTKGAVTSNHDVLLNLIALWIVQINRRPGLAKEWRTADAEKVRVCIYCFAYNYTLKGFFIGSASRQGEVITVLIVYYLIANKQYPAACASMSTLDIVIPASPFNLQQCTK